MIGKYLNLMREQKKTKTVEHEDASDTNCSGCTWISPLRLEKKTGGTEN